MNDSLIDKLKNTNKTDNALINPTNPKINLYNYFDKVLKDLHENNFNQIELQFILNNINSTLEYSKKILKANKKY